MSKHLLNLVLTDKIQLPGGCSILTFAGADGHQLPPTRPGQFVEVKIENSPGTMLRRPISISDVTPQGRMRLFVKPVGEGTEHLVATPIGQSVNMLMPLGNGFPIDDLAQGSDVLLTGGGVGTAPLIYLCTQLAARGHRPHVLIGARTANDIAGIVDLFDGAVDVAITTDDGSCGLHGMVTAHEYLDGSRKRFDRIYCCGPTPMMKAVARIAAQNGTECYVSLENMMACGLGACLCCVENTKEGHVCVCTQGPVFNINDLTWL